MVAGAATTGLWAGCGAAVSGAPQLSQNFAPGVAGVPHCAHFSSFTRFHFLCICYAIRRAIPVNNFLGMLSHLDYL